MHLKQSAAVLFGTVLTVTASLKATNQYWKDPTSASPPADLNFNNPANWTTTLPGAADTANFSYPTGSQRQLGTIGLSSNTSLGGFFVGVNANLGLDLAGQTLTLGNNGGGSISPTAVFNLSNSGTTGSFDASATTLQAADGSNFNIIGSSTLVKVLSMDVGVATGSGTPAVAITTVTNGALLTSNGTINVGSSGSGMMNIINGGQMTLTAYYGGQLTIGAANLTTGVVNVAGAGSLISTGNSPIAIGGAGTGTLNVGAGGTVNTSAIYLGYNGGQGVLNINGGTVNAGEIVTQYYTAANGSTLSITSGTLNTGYVSLGTASGQSSDFTVGDGSGAAIVTMSGGANVGNLTVQSNSILNLTNGTLSAKAIGGSGTFNWSGGGLSLATPMVLGAGQLLGNSITLGGTAARKSLTLPALNMSNGSSISIGNAALLNVAILTLSANSSLTMNPGSFVETQTLSVDPAASFNYNGGSLSVGGAFSTSQLINTTVSVANQAELEAYSFNISAGKTVSVSAGGYFSADSLTMDPTGSLLVGTNANIQIFTGSFDLGPVATTSNPVIQPIGGMFNFSGGGDLQIQQSHTTLTGPVLIGAGSLTVASLTLGNGGSVAFSNTGSGQLNVVSLLNLNASGGGTLNTAGLPAFARISAGNVNVSGGNLVIGNSQLLVVSGKLSIDPLSSVTLAGGSLSFPYYFDPTLSSSLSGAFNFSSGTLSLNTPLTDLVRQQFIQSNVLSANQKVTDSSDWNDNTNFNVSGNLSVSNIDSGTFDVTGTLTGVYLEPGTTVTIESGGFLHLYYNQGGNIIQKSGSRLQIDYSVLRNQPQPGQDIIGQNVELAANVSLLPGLSAVGNITIDHGNLLNGGGNSPFDVNGTLTVNGTLEPGDDPAKFTVEGNYVQPSDGTLEIEMDGGHTAGTDFGQLDVIPFNTSGGGVATLSGVLELVTIDGYAGKLGDSFPVLDASQLYGSFSGLDASQASLLSPSTTKWAVVYDYADGQVLADVVNINSPSSYGIGASGVPEPTSATAIALLASAGLLRRRRVCR